MGTRSGLPLRRKLRRRHAADPGDHPARDRNRGRGDHSPRDLRARDRRARAVLPALIAPLRLGGDRGFRYGLIRFRTYGPAIQATVALSTMAIVSRNESNALTSNAQRMIQR